MTIPEPPSPDGTPTIAYAPPSAPVTVSRPSSAIAIIALVVGGVAFLSGLAPVWGLIVGLAAVALGIFALVRKQRPLFAGIGLGLGAIAALTSLITTIVLFGSIGGLGNSDAARVPVATASPTAAPTTPAKPSATPKPTTTPTPTPTPTVAPTPTAAPAPPAPVESVSQKNANRKAQDYLNFTAFSRTGLIAQLEYEGFSNEDATYGTDAIGADWAQQAAKKAKQYLEFSSFSHSGLVDQLVYEGFTPDEAEFGVVAVGL